MVNQSAFTRKRGLDCSPRRQSTSELPEGSKISISRHDSVDRRGNGKAVLSRVLEGSMSKTTTDNNREKSSSVPSAKDFPIEHSRGASGAKGNKKGLLPDLQHHVNGPVKDFIWGGTVEVHDCGASRMPIEMLAHISEEVSRKAYAFAKKIDSLLRFKLYPRSDVYPKIFEDACPNRDDIALYFYPTQSERSKNEYPKLLKDMAIKDLTMRARIADRDLLVFPSTILAPESRKLNDCYYMWGVFCPAEMEIDLLAGSKFHRRF